MTCQQNGLRSVKDYVKVCGEPQNVQITKELFKAPREQQKVPAKRLSDEKEELVKKRNVQNAEKQRLSDAKKESEREAEKLERSRLLFLYFFLIRYIGPIFLKKKKDPIFSPIIWQEGS